MSCLRGHPIWRGCKHARGCKYARLQTHACVLLPAQVLADSVLRDLTREFMATILAIMRPFGAPPPGSAPATAAAGPKSPTGSGRRKDGGGGGAAAAGSAAADGGPGRAPQAGPGSTAIAAAAAGVGVGQGESLFETLVAADGPLAQVVVGCAVDGLCWPDSESASKAIGACRWAAGCALCA